MGFVSDSEAMVVVLVVGVLTELFKSDSDKSDNSEEDDERNLFFLFSISNSGDVNSLFFAYLWFWCIFSIFSNHNFIAHYSYHTFGQTLYH